MKYGDNDDFFKSCIWSIDDVTPATGTMLGNAKADQGDFITQKGMEKRLPLIHQRQMSMKDGLVIRNIK